MSDAENRERPMLGADAIRREVEQSRQFVQTFAQLLQVSRFHELSNAAVVPLLEEVSRRTEELCAGGRRLRVVFEREQVFANRRRVRFSMGALRRILAFVRRLERRGLTGFEIRGSMSSDDLSAFLGVFHGVQGGAASADLLDGQLAETGVSDIALLRTGAPEHEEIASVRMEEGQVAALLYAKIVVILRETIRCWEHDDTRRYLGARAKRVMQQIISLAEISTHPFLWLAHVKDEDEYLYTHSANVALLSILVGLRLGFDRNRACELGLAALFHDMGRIGLPTNLLTEKGMYGEGEREEMARHPIYGVDLLLRVGALNESLLRRIVVVFEHNIDANGYPRESWAPGLHLFSRIVAIADAYDAMTTRKSYRPAMTPDEAMLKLKEHSGTRYDADLVKVFSGVLEIFPLGTLVRLDTGEAGLVYHVDPSEPQRPLVKLALCADGTRYSDGEIVDLGEQDADGAFLRTIVGTEDAARHGIEAPSYITEGAE
ncbi:MAG: HD-GYP domain-containing protein [Planctomycetota bacterium]|jgi:HD-GYP domain-containing protein (c-di-GMP phosphodiesterase class II)